MLFATPTPAYTAPATTTAAKTPAIKATGFFFFFGPSSYPSKALASADL